ncbi:Hsp20/alpha crystallin family protein [Aeromicrobium sp. IC_218]|uniref:Hsp20/alpha crystallin family protein n=1 Tax=Aeromicrobium sp. IC_218 TaxID=2545468 RepID=UPI00103CE27D|nr:Hsp20/alpha crystallin family protein [Aeromicrobium sp. IC_218]TCI98650.1 Hsp20/alpha crystallin family protein [Aeromicrobium sp. IC_218]
MTTLSRFNRRDPFAEFDSLMRNAFAGTAPMTTERTDFMPAAETLRDGDDAVVRLELPGMDVENDVTVEAVSGRLVIRGERRDERAEDDRGRHVREIRYGRFERTFALPAHVGPDAISAGYDAGVLSIRVAGVYAGTEPTRIAVSSTSPKAVETVSGETADDAS